MDDEPWWLNRETAIADLESEETHVTYLHARETPEGWEYAIVTWRLYNPNVVLRFRNGRLLDSEPGFPLPRGHRP